jgi:hypothetical protein
MSSTRLFTWLLAAEMCISSSYAAPGIPMAPSEATTVGKFLSICSINVTLCNDEVRGALLNKLDLRNGAEICIGDPHFQTSVVDWLRIHPEVHQMPTDDGIYVAYKSLYPCH